MVKQILYSLQFHLLVCKNQRDLQVKLRPLIAAIFPLLLSMDSPGFLFFDNFDIVSKPNKKIHLNKCKKFLTNVNKKGCKVITSHNSIIALSCDTKQQQKEKQKNKQTCSIFISKGPLD